MPPSLTLITRPARSGKSDWAEQLAAQSSKPVVYIATACLDPTDADWQRRIEQHRARRPTHWQLAEVPLALPQAVQQAAPSHCLLIDSLGTWLANWIEADHDTWQQQQQALLTALSTTATTVIVVAEETGWGVVPAYPMGRCFRDRLGDLTRQVGAIATNTYLVTCGYALNLTHAAEVVTGLNAN
ncbi:MAG: bifunctional adenosylcobinamide kinase/adenosylcobinamide-phosphate guanylyltransferase [Cyanobacteria bacterium P01_A01_bin.105]